MPPQNPRLFTPNQDLNFPQEPNFDFAGTQQQVNQTHTPPWTEAPPYDSPNPAPWEMGPPLEGVTPDGPGYVHDHMNLPPHLPWQPRARVLEDYYYNDDQQDGGAVPPGHWNEQPFQSGHTQITILNQSAEQGWGQDPALRWARYPFSTGTFPQYAAGIHRRNGQFPAEKNFLQMVEVIGPQQIRDMALRNHTAKRPHGVVVSDAPTVPNTFNVIPVDPLQFYYGAPIGPEGVTPDWS